ncbi:MAG: ABC transporter substrate-binding protein [Synergistaceae bacterium]|nr:ABC transporter substrate-binding protein [Synergistaceae bacterium]
MARFALLILMLMMTKCPVNAEALMVISLYPGHSDNIYALGGGEILIALSENDDNDLLPQLPRLSVRSGAERLLALRPDTVVTRPFAERLNPNLYDVLRRAGVKIISIDPPAWDNFREYLMTLSRELNLDPQSAINRLDSALALIESSAPKSNRPHVFLEATSRELHTCSRDSWAARLIELAGGINIAEDAVPLRSGSAVAPYGVERVLRNAESLDVYIIQTGAMNSATLREFRAREWTKALGRVKVYEVPERDISRPSLLGLERGGTKLVHIFRGDE